MQFCCTVYVELHATLLNETFCMEIEQCSNYFNATFSRKKRNIACNSYINTVSKYRIRNESIIDFRYSTVLLIGCY